MARPRILVTNDDGVSAPGIRVLVEEASKLGEVVVVAPDSPQSGQGHAITISSPIRLKPVKLFDDILAYECSGTPVDSVKLAKNVVMKDQNFDLCVSGINHGSNVSVNILYSGTMSAAMEASLEGVDSIGFSFLDYSWEADFDVCRPIVRQIMEDVLKNGLGDCRLLNVNIPKLPAAEIKGIRISRQAEARWVEKFHEATDPRGQKYYWLTGEFVNNDLGEDTDVWALENGYVSVVPSGHDLTHHQSLDAIRGFLRPTIH